MEYINYFLNIFVSILILPMQEHCPLSPLLHFCSDLNFHFRCHSLPWFCFIWSPHDLYEMEGVQTENLLNSKKHNSGKAAGCRMRKVLPTTNDSLCLQECGVRVALIHYWWE